MCIYFDVLARDYEAALRRVAPGRTYDDQVVVLPPSLYQAELYWLLDRREDARRSFEQARRLLETRRSKNPSDRRVHAVLGEVYAALGRREEALAAAARAVELAPMSRNVFGGAPMVYWQARTLTLLGDKQAALDKLELLRACPFSAIGAPYGTTPVQLRLEPWWDPLRNEPRFQKLAQGR